MPVSDKVKLAAREQFPNATDDEIEQHYGEIKNQLAAQGNVDVTDDEIIQTFRTVVPELRNSMSTGPVMGDVERAEKKYAQELANMRLSGGAGDAFNRRMGERAVARMLDAGTGKTSRMDALTTRWGAEEEQLKDLTLGAAGRRTAARKEDMDLRSSELGLATKQQQYDITKDEQERAAKLREPDSEETQRLRAVLKPVAEDLGLDPDKLNGLNMEEMQKVLDVSSDVMELAIRKSQQDRLAEEARRSATTKADAAAEKKRKDELAKALRVSTSPESIKRRSMAKAALKAAGYTDEEIDGMILESMSGEDVDAQLELYDPIVKEKIKKMGDMQPGLEKGHEELAKRAATTLTEIPDRISSYEEQRSLLQELESLLKNNVKGLGPVMGPNGWLGKPIEQLGLKSEIEEQIDNIVAKLELARSSVFKGQGQISDSERAILKSSLPTRNYKKASLQEIIERDLNQIDNLIAGANTQRERIASFLDGEGGNPFLEDRTRLPDVPAPAPVGGSTSVPESPPEMKTVTRQTSRGPRTYSVPVDNSELPQVKTQEDFDKLKVGDLFIDDQGRRRRKQ